MSHRNALLTLSFLVVSLVFFVRFMHIFEGASSDDIYLDSDQKIVESVQVLREKQPEREKQEQTSDSTNPSLTKGEDVGEIRVILKDARPLSQETILTPNPNLWKYQNYQELPPGGINGPFYSQAKQDRFLYSGFFRSLRGGTFVELGAVDGITLSNTKFFQDQLGWSGVLIEPSKDFEYLTKGIARYSTSSSEAKVFNGFRCLPEKNVFCVNKAICRKPGFIEFVHAANRHGGSLVGGAKELLTDAHKKMFHVVEESVYKVECVPIGIILKEYGIKRIDLFSIDVEGSEEIVLDTMDWQIPVHVIVIEAHEYNSPTGKEGHERKHRILLQNGFQYLMTLDYDEWWVNPENERK